MPGIGGNMTRTLLLGASGLVGSEALRIALDRSDVSRVVAPTRHALPQHPKLINPVSSTLESLLSELPNWDVESVMCALGTTRKKAGSDQGLRPRRLGDPAGVRAGGPPCRRDDLRGGDLDRRDTDVAALLRADQGRAR